MEEAHTPSATSSTSCRNRRNQLRVCSEPRSPDGRPDSTGRLRLWSRPLHDTHADLMRKCLRPGRIVLCEKPFTTSYRDAVDLANEAKSTGALLYVGHFRRNFPQVQLARSLVELGVVGEITDMFVSEGGRFTWKAVSDYTIRDEHGGVLVGHRFARARYGTFCLVSRRLARLRCEGARG